MLDRIGFLAAMSIPVFLLAGCKETPTNRMKTAIEVRPVVFDWVGTWSGEATGTDRGSQVEETVELVISFDRTTDCETCVRVRVGDLFDWSGFLIESPIRTELSYEHDGLWHWMTLEKFTAGSGAGNTIIGRVEVRELASPPQSGKLLYGRDIAVMKQ